MAANYTTGSRTASDDSGPERSLAPSPSTSADPSVEPARPTQPGGPHPAPPPPEAAPDADEGGASEQTQKVVLVADDDAAFRALARHELELGGYQVIEAADGQVALACLRDGAIDLALLDVRMPRLTGYDVLRLIGDRNAPERVPVLLLSVDADASRVAEGLRLGAQDFLRKPVETGELLARIDAALRISGAFGYLEARNQHLEHSSRVDDLTGLWNRRYLAERMTAAASFTRRHETSYALLVIDVDQFKEVNDRLGHGWGDAVLRELAGRLGDNTRAEDTCGRWGGDEFMVVLPYSGIEGAVSAAEKLRRAIAERPVTIDDTAIPITVTVGCAAGTGTAPEQLIAAADAALYAGKAAGRNRVERADDLRRLDFPPTPGPGPGDQQPGPIPALPLPVAGDDGLRHEAMGAISVIKGWAVLLGTPRLTDDQRQSGLAAMLDSANKLEDIIARARFRDR